MRCMLASCFKSNALPVPLLRQVSLRFHFDCTPISLRSPGEKGRPPAPKREKGTPAGAKRGKGTGEGETKSGFPPYIQTARTHARTETEIDFPVGLTPPTSDLQVMTLTFF